MTIEYWELVGENWGKTKLPMITYQGLLQIGNIQLHILPVRNVCMCVLTEREMIHG